MMMMMMMFEQPELEPADRRIKNAVVVEVHPSYQLIKGEGSTTDILTN